MQIDAPASGASDAAKPTSADSAANSSDQPTQNQAPRKMSSEELTKSLLAKLVDEPPAAAKRSKLSVDAALRAFDQDEAFILAMWSLRSNMGLQSQAQVGVQLLPLFMNETAEVGREIYQLLSDGHEIGIDHILQTIGNHLAKHFSDRWASWGRAIYKVLARQDSTCTEVTCTQNIYPSKAHH